MFLFNQGLYHAHRHMPFVTASHLETNFVRSSEGWRNIFYLILCTEGFDLTALCMILIGALCVAV